MIDSALRKDVLLIMLIIGISLAASALTVIVLTEQAIQHQRQEILESKIDTARLLAGRFELRMEDAMKVLQIAVKSEPLEENVASETGDENLKGISEEADSDKRDVAADVLSEYKTFETVGYVLPNGDIYFVEPYQNQLNLPRLNFADREWYQGVMQTRTAYAGDPIVSAASGNKVVPIAVPIYSEDGRLNGLLVAGLNLGSMKQQLIEELDLKDNNRVIYVDDQGNAIEDVSEAAIADGGGTASPEVSDFSAVKSVLAGESGSILETINGKQMLEVYHPIYLPSQHWGVVLVQPTVDAFYALDYLRYQSYVMLAIIGTITGTTGFLLVRFRVKSSLAKQLEKANKELMTKDKLKNEFILVASHELRTPIQPILGATELMMKEVLAPKEAAKLILPEVKRLKQLANNILDVSKVEAGMLEYDMKPLIINDIITKEVEAARKSLLDYNKAAKLKIEMNLDAYPELIVKGDTSRLGQLFANLLTNGIKFTDEGFVKVSSKVLLEKREVKILVTDTGSDIPHDLLPKLFDKFSCGSADGGTMHGAGLGLFLCNAIASAHGGRIKAYNNSDKSAGHHDEAAVIPDKGVTVEIFLPLLLEAAIQHNVMQS